MIEEAENEILAQAQAEVEEALADSHHSH